MAEPTNVLADALQGKSQSLPPEPVSAGASLPPSILPPPAPVAEPALSPTPVEPTLPSLTPATPSLSVPASAPSLEPMPATPVPTLSTLPLAPVTPPPAAPVSAPAIPAPAAKKTGWLWLVLLLVLIAIVGGVAFWWWREQSAVAPATAPSTARTSVPTPVPVAAIESPPVIASGLTAETLEPAADTAVVHGLVCPYGTEYPSGTVIFYGGPEKKMLQTEITAGKNVYSVPLPVGNYTAFFKPDKPGLPIFAYTEYVRCGLDPAKCTNHALLELKLEPNKEYGQVDLCDPQYIQTGLPEQLQYENI